MIGKQLSLLLHHLKVARFQSRSKCAHKNCQIRNYNRTQLLWVYYAHTTSGNLDLVTWSARFHPSLLLYYYSAMFIFISAGKIGAFNDGLTDVEDDNDERWKVHNASNLNNCVAKR